MGKDIDFKDFKRRLNKHLTKFRWEFEGRHFTKNFTAAKWWLEFREYMDQPPDEADDLDG